MANMYNIDSLSYQPSTNPDWFTKAIFGGTLIEGGHITPITGVKESTYLNLLGLDGVLLQSDGRDCAWTPEQLLKLSEKLLSVKTYKINLEQCLDDLERKRTIYLLSPGAKNRELPDELEGATMELLALELSKVIEAKVFNGTSSTAGDFDGAIEVLKNSTESIKISGIDLTKSNVLEEIEKVFNSIPEDVLRKGLENGTLRIAASFQTIVKVKQALSTIYNGNVVVNPNFSITGDDVFYMGVQIIPVAGMNNSTLIAYNTDNFILGTDLMNDLEEIRLGQFPAPHDSKIFIDGRLRLGFVIPFEDEVVFYSKDNVPTT